nr:protein unc-80 homolog [Cherax quadricarinatus]
MISTLLLRPASLVQQANQSALTDPTLATFLDVAVLRCLFVHQWMEEGVYWAINFIYRRLQDIGEETGHNVPPRRRSNSLPIPKIHVSLHCDAADERKPREGPEQCDQSYSDYISDSPFLSDHPCPQREGMTSSGGSTRKKKKLDELKAFVETKLRSCSEKALEKIGHDDSRRSSVSEEPGGAGGEFGRQLPGIIDAREFKAQTLL